MPEAARAATTHKRLAPHSDIARMNSAYIMRQVGVSAKDFKEREVGNLLIFLRTRYFSLSLSLSLYQDVKNLLNELDKENALLEIVNEVSGKLVKGVLAASENSDETLVCTCTTIVCYSKLSLHTQ